MSTNKVSEKAIKEIINLSKDAKTKEEALKIKRKIMKKHKISIIMKDSDLYLKSKLSIFKRKPSRKLSGVSVIAVMTSPAKCPHGKCVFCPGGVEHSTPQSYTGLEPAALRAISNNYNPYLQVKNRISQYLAIGQIPSKVELIVMGGTFTNRLWKYQKNFIKECFRALNDSKDGSLKQMQKINETAKYRCIGITIETRPDQISNKSIEKMLELGATRVELGVQSIHDNVLKASKRGHNSKDIIRATRLLKNAGFKINYHLMTNMPLSTPKKDYESFKKIFSNEDFKPDMIKIYPTLLIKETKLYEMFEKKQWKPYSKEKTIELIARMKRIIPEYVRVMRIQRDIPSQKIEQDLKNSNLRQIVKEFMKEKSWSCKCIRCREAGRNKGNINNLRYKTLKYVASGSEEYFIQAIDSNNFLFGFIRARIEGKKLFIRELHVYGEQAIIGNEGSVQHKGIGKELLRRAEEIAKKNSVKEVLVISGVGVRKYYEKQGYFLKNFYMAKRISA
ncbi:MAG: tRNA uridine(34) 5-carboxymethylaminomethyl modification radical SAM/GNAT enzyme Elp3 [Candidatus Nanoarchaeia archaeon]|nr:tRNA uridine(34) 5-carboxymethylaminomethyl modification radical SAM/GNAT enzyme Elp3 [Candidatus Nanoarchaeia archaeon]